MAVESLKKVLSPTDAGESNTHQSGILVPVTDGERVFPDLVDIEDGDFFDCEDQTGKIWRFKFKHRVKPSESRITYTKDFIKRYGLQSKDAVVISSPDAEGQPYRIAIRRTAKPQPLPGEERLDLAPEGAVRTARVNAYERNPQNRKRAIERHGVACFGCDRKLAETYGQIAEGFIHIHHTKPLHGLGAPRAPTVDDLVPLCPNCHAIVHLRRPPLTIPELQQLIEDNQDC